ncbi:hypothetical protein AAG570_009972 [Ranatra chinensis]|uniref:Uncharacterized protein n=1 Tax=Ranatra chinensis TaxID=642074 RepID=A0ABD0ZDY5_9HEMI
MVPVRVFQLVVVVVSMCGTCASEDKNKANSQQPPPPLPPLHHQQGPDLKTQSTNRCRIRPHSDQCTRCSVSVDTPVAKGPRFEGCSGERKSEKPARQTPSDFYVLETSESEIHSVRIVIRQTTVNFIVTRVKVAIGRYRVGKTNSEQETKVYTTTYDPYNRGGPGSYWVRNEPPSWNGASYRSDRYSPAGYPSAYRPPTGYYDPPPMPWPRYDTAFPRDYTRYDNLYDNRYNAYDSRYNNYDTRYNSYDNRYNGYDNRYNSYDSRYNSYDNRYNYDGRYNSYDGRYNSYDNRYNYDGRYNSYDGRYNSYDNRYDSRYYDWRNNRYDYDRYNSRNYYDRKYWK